MPWSWAALQQVQAASLKPLALCLQAVTLHATAAAGGGGGAGVGRLLDSAISHAYRVHQFVGGLDAACVQALDALAPLWHAAHGTTAQPPQHRRAESTQQ